MAAKVFNVLKGTPAYKAGIKRGDTIYKINGRDINDYLDYMYQSSNGSISVDVGEKVINIENPDFEPLGIEFDSLLIDDPKSCNNKCIFCFIDQLPPDMRESCYFKDDDYRLSFLQGNYVTLTNLKDEELKRIIEYNIPRINISVHTTNPELRKFMLNNKFAGKILEQIKILSQSGIMMNCQIVLCPGINDGKELEKTIEDLFAFSDNIESVSVVPVGLSNYRSGLFELRSFTKIEAKDVILICEKLQKKYREALGINFVYLADEFYITADEEIPEFDEYDGFPQLENGVGLCASLKDEFEYAISSIKKLKIKKKKTIVTGYISYEFMLDLVKKLDTDKINVERIQNNFFGEKITVTGLIVGRDIVSQLKGKQLGDELIITKSMLRHDENVFLDNMTVNDVERELNIKIKTVNNDGYELLEALID